MYYYGRRDAASRLYNINVAILITHHCPHWNDNFATLFSGAFGQVQSSRSGNESFLACFRSLSSHTTVHAVRHTAV